MKFRTLKNWTNPGNSEGLIFFAQLLEELLFDYSLDTYKPSAMNSSLLCFEAMKLVRDIEDGLIDKANLSHVLDELVMNLKKDEVAISLLPIGAEIIASKLKNKDTPIAETFTLLELINAQIEPIKYKAKTELLLMDAVSKPQEKDRIRSLTRSYVTTLINMGYSTRFLYPSARLYFYWGDAGIGGPQSLQGFIDIASENSKNYSAIFKVNALFEEIKDSCEALKTAVYTELPAHLLGFMQNKSFKAVDREIYIVVENIEAMDVFSARDQAERRMEQISTLYSLFHHKESVEWNHNALLIDLDTKKDRIVSASPNQMLMCSDSKKEKAAIKLNSFIKNFSLEKSSFTKFNRAAELHSLALKNDSPENQLLNLWVALETIVPNRSNQKAKINNIIESILPFIALTYLKVLTEKLMQDFCLWNRIAFNRAIQNIEGADDKSRMLKLLLLTEHSNNKNQLFEDLRDFHLLRNRAHYFSQELSSTKKIAKILRAHWQRVDWQIRRIYRTRNLIVHAGHTPPYTATLIKNTHDYLDIVLNVVSMLASDGNKFNSIDSTFKYADLKYEEYIQLLDHSNQEITKDNIYHILLQARI